MASNKSAMRAVVLQGGNMVFKHSYAIPKCGAGNVLVRVKAAAINPIDYYKVGRFDPRILVIGSVVGLDASGVVEEVGSKVTNFSVGDEVYGFVPGSLADFALANPEQIAFKPKKLTFVEATAMPLTYTTSLQGLRDYGAFKKGGRVLVIGASGGTGVQLTRSMGAGKIVAVCNGKNAELVNDYTEHSTVNYFRDGATSRNIIFIDHIYKLTEEGWQGENGEQQHISPVVAHQFQFNSENLEKGFELLKSRRVDGKVLFEMTNMK